MKRIISLLLALVLVVGMLPLSVFAAELAITQQPKSVKVLEGQTAKVILKATGDDLTYKWYYKNPGETKYSYTSSFKSNSYSITMNEARNGRYVYCKVYDSNGNYVKSNTVSLRMAEPVKITAQPKNVSVANGESAKVSVTASGDGLTYQWYVKNLGKTTFSKSSITKSTYSVTMKDTVSGRQVYCIVTDKYGASEKSSIVTLSMASSVKITTQPTNVTVAKGESAKVSVVASGEGLTYQWYVKNAGKTTFSKSSITKNVYSVTMTDSVNGRQVYCIVTDKNGISVQSNTVTLSMASGVKIIQEPVSVRVAEGEKATVTVKATGEGLTYKWYYKNPDETEYSYTSSFTGSSYSITMNAERNGRYVYCRVSDKYGNTVKSKTVSLRMEESFRITKQPENVVARDGSVVSFSVQAAGGKAPYTYQWQYICDGQDYQNLTDSYTWLSRSTTDTLTVNVSDTHFRYHNVYRCIVTDANGKTVTSNEAWAEEKLPLTITKQPEIVFANEGDTVSFSVEVSGGRAPYTYQWQYEWEGSIDWENVEDSWYGYDGALTDTLSVIVDDYNFHGGDRYRCIITDADGDTVTSEKALSKEPLYISTQPVDALARVGDTVYLTVEASGGMGPYSYQWQYNMVNMGSRWSDMREGSVNQVTNCTAKKLSIGVSSGHFTLKYQFRCVITDAAGNQVISNAAKPVERTGSMLMITSQPKNCIADVGDTASFRVGVGGGKYPYTLQWQRSYYGSDWKDMPGSASFTLSFTVTDDREFDDEYRYRCVITDADGDQVISNVVKVMKPLVITSQTGDVYISTTAAPKIHNIEVTVTGGTLPYRYQWYGIDDMMTEPKELSNYDNVLEILLQDIRALWHYRIWCVITDADGNTVTSDEVHVKQALTITQQPQSQTGKVGDTLTYTVAVAGGMAPYSYQWYSKAQSGQWIESTTNAPNYKFEVNMITAMQTYSFYCIITDADGNQVTTNTVTFKPA